MKYLLIIIFIIVLCAVIPVVRDSLKEKKEKQEKQSLEKSREIARKKADDEWNAMVASFRDTPIIKQLLSDIITYYDFWAANQKHSLQKGNTDSATTVESVSFTRVFFVSCSAVSCRDAELYYDEGHLTYLLDSEQRIFDFEEHNYALQSDSKKRRLLAFALRDYLVSEYKRRYPGVVAKGINVESEPCIEVTFLRTVPNPDYGKEIRPW